VNASEHAIIACDGAGIIIGWNRGASALLGYDAAEVVGQPLARLIPRPDLKKQQALIERLQRSEMPLPITIRHRHKSGRLLSTTVALALTLSPDGQISTVTQMIAGSLPAQRRTRAQSPGPRKTGRSQARDREYHLRQMMEALPQMPWMAFPDGAAYYFSPRWQDFTGIGLADQLGFGWLQHVVHEEQRASVASQWSEAIEHCRPFRAEFRVRSADGRRRWVEVSVAPVFNRDRSIVRWFGTFTDVSEMHDTRRELSAERERFAQVVASAPGMIYSYRLTRDGKTTFPFVSAGIRDLYGISAEALAVDATLTVPLIHPKDMERMWPAILESARNLTPFHSEWRVNHPLKGELWVEGRAVPTRETDRSTLWYGIIVDITKRKRAEEALRDSQSRLQAAVAAGGIGTWIWDVANDRIWFDETMLKMWGRTPEEVQGQSTSVTRQWIHPDDRAAVETALNARAVTGGPARVEFRIQRRDGTWRWIAANGGVERDAEGNVVRHVGACSDITTRKHDEEMLRRSQKLEALGTLAGGIAHDFNNILLAISGNTRLAITDLAIGHPALVSLQEVDKASQRAAQLVQRILAFSRQNEPQREILSLQPIVDEALQLLRSTLPAMIEIRSSFAPDLPNVSADSTQIHQVVMNLITNAAHAIGEGPGYVSVTVESLQLTPESSAAAGNLPPGRYLCLSVSDSGVGMSAATIDRIFDPFFTTKPAGQGTGLGLSVVHGIVRSLGGGITVQSASGLGSVFRLYFPAAERLATGAVPVRNEPPPGRGQRVMYIDDEDALVYLAKRTLERLGYSVSGFTDPSLALEAFRSDPGAFDVIVTDQSMPGMSGLHLSEALLRIRPNIPIVMTSGYVRTSDREVALRIGVRHLIPKPNTIDELGHMLVRLFEQEQVAPDMDANELRKSR
jgi:PAS domain S-box-containing protein